MTQTDGWLVALAVVAVGGWGDAGAALLLVGAGLYLGGAIVLAVAFHLPRNDALDAVATGGEAGQWVPLTQNSLPSGSCNTVQLMPYSALSA